MEGGRDGERDGQKKAESEIRAQVNNRRQDPRPKGASAGQVRMPPLTTGFGLSPSKFFDTSRPSAIPHDPGFRLDLSAVCSRP